MARSFPSIIFFFSYYFSFFFFAFSASFFAFFWMNFSIFSIFSWGVLKWWFGQWSCGHLAFLMISCSSFLFLFLYSTILSLSSPRSSPVSSCCLILIFLQHSPLCWLAFYPWQWQWYRACPHGYRCWTVPSFPYFYPYCYCCYWSAWTVYLSSYRLFFILFFIDCFCSCSSAYSFLRSYRYFLVLCFVINRRFYSYGEDGWGYDEIGSSGCPGDDSGSLLLFVTFSALVYLFTFGTVIFDTEAVLLGIMGSGF